MNFSVIDIVFIVLIALLMIRCFIKGFISEVLTMAAFVLGAFASLFLYKNGAEYLKETFWPDMEIIPEIVAFIALFLIVFVIVKLLELLLKGIVQGINLGAADKFLGLLFGIAEGFAVVGIILFILHIQPLFDHLPIIQDSFFAKILMPLITGTGKTSNV